MFGQKYCRQCIGLHIFEEGVCAGPADRFFRLNSFAVQETYSIDDSIESFQVLKCIVHGILVCDVQLSGSNFFGSDVRASRFISESD